MKTIYLYLFSKWVWIGEKGKRTLVITKTLSPHQKEKERRNKEKRKEKKILFWVSLMKIIYLYLFSKWVFLYCCMFDIVIRALGKEFLVRLIITVSRHYSPIKPLVVPGQQFKTSQISSSDKILKVKGAAPACWA